jgi:solute carrier family 13 (sodium-dependent dicarboxylate transporter), member 2/3/5
MPMLVVLAIVCFGILLLTELTSNTATAATFLPIAGALALSLGENPLLFLIPTALAANCSYMMPVGTPPNAIVYGSGLITLPQMARAGLLLNVALVPIVLALLLLLGPVCLRHRGGHRPGLGAGALTILARVREVVPVVHMCGRAVSRGRRRPLG